MNGRDAKVLRRGLRRAVGIEGVGLLDEHAQVLAHQVLPNLHAVQIHVRNLDERLEVIERGSADRWQACSAAHKRLADDAAAFTYQGFWARLCWLLRGPR